MKLPIALRSVVGKAVRQVGTLAKSTLRQFQQSITVRGDTIAVTFAERLTAQRSR